MNCKQIIKHLDDYRSGNLDKILLQALEKHIQQCPTCRKAFENEKSVSDFLKTAKSAEADLSVADIVIKKLAVIDQETRTKNKSEHEWLKDSRVKWLMVIALLLGIGLAAVLVIPFDSQTERQHIGSRSGSGYTWMGNFPLEDPLESWWQDESLSSPYDFDTEQDKLGDRDTGGSDSGRITHILNFSDSPEKQTLAEEETP